MQEAFIRAFTRLQYLKEPSKFGAWVAAIATNLARDFFKREKRIFLTPEPVDYVTPDPGPSLEDQVLRREKADRVRAALRLLPPEQYQVIILQYYYDLKLEDVAELTGTTSGTVKSRLHRARRKLYEILQDGEPDEGLERLINEGERGEQC